MDSAVDPRTALLAVVLRWPKSARSGRVPVRVSFPEDRELVEGNATVFGSSHLSVLYFHVATTDQGVHLDTIRAVPGAVRSGLLQTPKLI